MYVRTRCFGPTWLEVTQVKPREKKTENQERHAARSDFYTPRGDLALKKFDAVKNKVLVF